MHRYIIKRLLMLIPVLLGVAFIIFAIMSVAEGDPVYQVAGPDATEEQLEALREEMGLNGSLIERYFRYIGNLLKGDLGVSYVTKLDVMQLYLLLMLLFSLKLGWLPSGGAEGFTSVILPAVTVGVGLAALLTRTTRSSMLDVLRQDYLRTARAKGVSERKVVYVHALRNALIPIITIFGVQFSNVLGGSVLAETVFAWPGVGRLVVDAIDQRDIPTVTGALIMTTMLVTIVNLLVDIIYAYVDPRIKAQYTK